MIKHKSEKEEKLGEHFHCKECGKIIKLIYDPFGMNVLHFEGRLQIASEELKICKECIMIRGIVYCKKKRRTK